MIILVGLEHFTREEAWAKLEGTRFMALLQEVPSPAWEGALLYRCSCMERDLEAVDMEVYLPEQAYWESENRLSFRQLEIAETNFQTQAGTKALPLCACFRC